MDERRGYVHGLIRRQRFRIRMAGTSPENPKYSSGKPAKAESGWRTATSCQVDGRYLDKS
jgi:hypothetical protein